MLFRSQQSVPGIYLNLERRLDRSRPVVVAIDQRLRLGEPIPALGNGGNQRQTASIGNAELADELLLDLLAVLGQMWGWLQRNLQFPNLPSA